MQQYQTSEEIIKEAKELFKANPNLTSEAHFTLGYLKQHYDTLLQSISEETKDKFIAANPDAPTYEELLEEHEDWKEESKKISDNLFDTIAQITKTHAKKNYGIDINLKNKT